MRRNEDRGRCRCKTARCRRYPMRLTSLKSKLALAFICLAWLPVTNAAAQQVPPVAAPPDASGTPLAPAELPPPPPPAQLAPAPESGANLETGNEVAPADSTDGKKAKK